MEKYRFPLEKGKYFKQKCKLPSLQFNVDSVRIK